MKPIRRHPHSNPLLLFFFFFFLLILLVIQITSSFAQNLSPSQIKTLLRIQHILEYPPSLSLLNNITSTTTNNNNINLCYLPSTSSLSISCLGTRITQLAITGNTTSSSSSLLSPSFSLDSLFTTLSRLPNLTSLSLLSLGLWGPLPPKIDRLSSLRTLNLTSNHLSGPIPSQLSSLSALQYLDLSSNRLAGTLPASLFSLPSLQYLDLSANTLTGALPPNLTCAPRLAYVDVSANRLLGALPSCLASNSSTRVVLNSWNCMAPANSTLQQHAPSFCSKDPIAAILPPVVHKDEGRGSAKSRLGLILGIVGGILGGAAFLGLLVLLVFKKAKSETTVKSIKLPNPVMVMAKASVQVSPRTPTETRHMSQAVRIGTLGLTPYRVFTMEELDEATNGFDPINFISEGPRGQFYKGWLHDGSIAVIRCLKLKQKLSPQSLAQYMDVISKLRHVNLVSFLGHCIPTDQENSITDNTIFLVFEYVSNGTLRSHLTEWRKREMLKWPQRVAAVIGVARGIQFLHTVTVPGLVGNDLSIENILLDETLMAKISNYNLPMLSRSKNNKVGSESPFGTVEDNDHGSLEHGEKEDVYQLGLILLEIITGKPTESTRELDALKVELQESLTEAPAKLREITDPTIRGTFAVDSLQTLVTVALNCVAKDHRERPSIDDILWNLQYSVQVQDGWTSSDSLSIHSYN